MNLLGTQVPNWSKEWHDKRKEGVETGELSVLDGREQLYGERKTVFSHYRRD